MKDLMRQYERARFPADRRLDVHGEGPRAARDRVLHWIQSRAHETPGEELLLIVERGRTAGRRSNAVTGAIQELLETLTGRLIDWWQPFTPGSIAFRIARDPRMIPLPVSRAPEPGDGRTVPTSGAARPSPLDDIPAELLGMARAATELRIFREGLTVRVEEIVLREIWIEAQATAMERRIGFAEGLETVLEAEKALARAAED
jgi:hypothetical protein